ncbi:hypothetical protein B0H10DRAFT_1797283 [Mycena sp. CBHHK59/15]|nr:hypothetical protein B0H10DRAFT_1797283 [Mycena sp. CBHHK59/15]
MGDQVFPLERSWYIGNAIFAILYGIQLTMFFQSVYYLTAGPGSRRSKRFYVGYGAVLLVLITFAMACNLFYGQAMWIEHRDVDGGPAAYFGENIAIWYNTLGTASDVTANVLGDALMLYRCYIFWGHAPLALVFPALLFLASVSMGIVQTIQSGLPGGDLFHGTAVNFGIPWVVLTITFNILVTGMIAVRLLSMHAKADKVLGTETTKKYTGLLAILVESALPFTLLGIGYLVTYTKEVPESLAFADIWGCFVSLSPQAIILRVAMGAAWTKETVTRVSSGVEYPDLENAERGVKDEKYSPSS